MHIFNRILECRFFATIFTNKHFYLCFYMVENHVPYSLLLRCSVFLLQHVLMKLSLLIFSLYLLTLFPLYYLLEYSPHLVSLANEHFQDKSHSKLELVFKMFKRFYCTVFFQWMYIYDHFMYLPSFHSLFARIFSHLVSLTKNLFETKRSLFLIRKAI